MVSDTKLQSEWDKYRYDELDDVLGAYGPGDARDDLELCAVSRPQVRSDPERDYYRMLAAFTTSKRVEVPFMSAEESAAFQEETGEFDKRMAATTAELEALSKDAAEGTRSQTQGRRAVGEIPPRASQGAVTTDEGPQPAKSFLLHRGDPSHQDAQVTLGFLSVLTPESEEPRFKPDPPPGARTTFHPPPSPAGSRT